MSEETKTKTVGGSGGLQRRPEKEILEEIQVHEEDEALCFQARGYGGYINTCELDRIREEKAACCAELSDGHPAKVANAKENARRAGR